MKKLGKFLSGLGLGVGLGMLFAPKKGSEFRQELKTKLDELFSQVKDMNLGDVKELIESKIDEIKVDLDNFDKEKIYKEAKKKSKEIIGKADELVKLAVKKGTPALEKLTQEVKEKTVNVLEEALAKLNKNDK